MDKRKGIILAVVLFLLIGLGTFVFADEPNDDPGKNTGETNGPSDTNNDGSTTNPDEESEVQDEENSGTDDEGTTATNRRPSNSGSTEIIIGGGTGGDTPSTDNPSSDNGSNAGEGEENPGEVTEDPDTTAPVITINGESYQGKGNNIGYVNGDVILSLAEKNLEVVVTKDGEELSFEDDMTLSLDGKYVITVTDEAGNITEVEVSIDKSAPVVTGIEDGDITNTIGSITVADDNEVTILLNGNKVALEDIASLAEEGENVLIVKDSLDNQTSITFTYDTTPIQAEWLYTLNSTYHNTNLVDKHYQVIGDGQKLYVELVFAEEFESVPTIAVGASEAVNMSCEWTNWETERQYYKCDATITIDGASQSLVNNAELPILITNIVDAAGNPTRLDNTNITDNGTYGEVIYDKEAPVYESLGVLNVTHLRENNNGASGDLTVVNVGDEIRVLLRFNEILEVNPTITIGGFEYKLELKTDYQNFAEYTYLVDIKITEEMKLDNGKIDFEISGYADAAGNGGEKLTAEDINHTKFTGVELDTIDPGSNDDATGANWVYILNLSDANNRQTIGNGQTLRVEVKIDEELASIPKLEIGNTQSVDFKSCTQQSYGYICVADIKIDNSIAHLVHGEDIPFKITNIIDAAGNKTVLDNDDVTYTTDYGQVKFDGKPPKISALGITGFLDEAEYDPHYVTDGKGIRILTYFSEELGVAPTITINGHKFTAYAGEDTDPETNTYSYHVDIEDVAVLGLDDGVIEFTVSGYKDKFGNEGEVLTQDYTTYDSYDQVIYDKSPTTFNFNNGDTFNDFTVKLTEANLQRLEVYSYGTGLTDTYYGDEGLEWTLNTGNCMYKLMAYDLAGNYSEIWIYHDKTAPSVTGTGKVASKDVGFKSGKKYQEVHLVVTDNDLKEVKLVNQLTGAEEVICAFNWDNTSDCAVDYDKEGKYNLVVIDRANNQSKYEVIIDTTAPTFDLSQIPTEFEVGVDVYEYPQLGKVTDNMDGTISFGNVHMNWYHMNGEATTCFGGDNWNTSLKECSLGDYIITYRVSDTAGNETIVEKQITLQDTTKAVIEPDRKDGETFIQGVDEYNTETGTITDNYDDVNFSAVNIEYYLKNNDGSETHVAYFDKPSDLSNIQAGVYRIHYWYRDSSDNYSEVSRILYVKNMDAIEKVNELVQDAVRAMNDGNMDVKDQQHAIDLARQEANKLPNFVEKDAALETINNLQAAMDNNNKYREVYGYLLSAQEAYADNDLTNTQHYIDVVKQQISNIDGFETEVANIEKAINELQENVNNKKGFDNALALLETAQTSFNDGSLDETVQYNIDVARQSLSKFEGYATEKQNIINALDMLQTNFNNRKNYNRCLELLEIAKTSLNDGSSDEIVQYNIDVAYQSLEKVTGYETELANIKASLDKISDELHNRQ